MSKREIIKVLSKFEPDPETKITLIQYLIDFLDSASIVRPLVPLGELAVAEVFSDEVVSFLEEYGIEPTANVSGIMFGLAKE